MDYDDKRIDALDRKRDKQRVKTKRKHEERAAYGGIFDKQTHEIIKKLYVKGILFELVGIISAGKEANVYFGYGKNNHPIAIKIYKIDPQNTKWMKTYIIGDPRFKKIGSTTIKIIQTWCKKEFKNLVQMKKAGMNVPNPIIAIDSVLVMDFIGEQDGNPAPRLKDIKELNNPQNLLAELIDQIQYMYQKAGLVHGDLSEFNMLYFNDSLTIIDVSQAVSISHANANFLLERDLTNILNFFAKYIPEVDIPSIQTLMEIIISGKKSESK
jgi:RIO kinase 1